MLNENCPCKREGCERHGNCDECRRFHTECKPELPVFCEREAEVKEAAK